MNPGRKELAILCLHWVLGLVVLMESARFALSPFAVRQFYHTGLPRRARPSLRGSEAPAALLFLVPATTQAGGYTLLLVFVVAGVIHMVHGDFDLGGLLVYGTAVRVGMIHREKGSAGGVE